MLNVGVQSEILLGSSVVVQVKGNGYS